MKILQNITFLAFLFGLVTGTVTTSIFLVPEKTLVILESFQAVVIILATIFTAWWTSKTFGHELKSKEAKEILSVLLLMRSYVAEIASPFAQIPALGNEITVDNLIEKWEERKEEARTDNWYRYKAQKSVLQELVEKSIALKPYTRMQLLMIGDFKDSIQDIKADKGKKLSKDIIALQHKVAEESYFDIGIQIIKLRNKFGLWFS